MKEKKPSESIEPLLDGHSEGQRIEEIRKSIKEYHQHKNDRYAYDPDEIDAVREVRAHAVENIEFLLAVIDKKSK